MVLLRRREGLCDNETDEESASRTLPSTATDKIDKQQAQQKQQDHKHKQRFMRNIGAERTALLTLFVTIIAWNVLWDIAKRHFDAGRARQSFQHVLEPSKVEPCTFDDLDEAFFPTRNHKQLQVQQTETCFSLSENIIRVPADSIVNRHDLPKLGSGCKGVVYRAIIQFPQQPDKQSTNKRYCAAALKTDQCQSMRHLIKKETVSCVAPDAVMTHPQSFLAAEYMGALIFYASNVHNKRETVNSPATATSSGVLPTWALVHGRPVVSWLPRFLWGWYGTPHTDQTLLGVLMPLIPAFETVSRGKPPNATALQTARTFLPAAKGLESVHSLGLVFQDIVEKNIAVDYVHETSFLFDHSYLGQVPSVARASSYCQERVFPQADRQISRVQCNDAVTSDVLRFRRVLVQQLKLSQHFDSNPQAQKLFKQLHRIKTLAELVLLLEGFIAS